MLPCSLLVAVLSRRMQIGIDAARKPEVVPVAAPLELVAVHVVDAPRIGGIASDRGGPFQ